jgi:hypothetical protein
MSNFKTISSLSTVYREAKKLVEYADRIGVVLTIEQKPLKPLAMGHYKTSISVRPKRMRTK